MRKYVYAKFNNLAGRIITDFIKVTYLCVI